ncbi:unnamed protein product, partial [Closterium sp. NIES-53]
LATMTRGRSSATAATAFWLLTLIALATPAIEASSQESAAHGPITTTRGCYDCANLKMGYFIKDAQDKTASGPTYPTTATYNYERYVFDSTTPPNLGTPVILSHSRPSLSSQAAARKCNPDFTLVPPLRRDFQSIY